MSPDSSGRPPISAITSAPQISVESPTPTYSSEQPETRRISEADPTTTPTGPMACSLIYPQHETPRYP